MAEKHIDKIPGASSREEGFNRIAAEPSPAKSDQPAPRHVPQASLPADLQRPEAGVTPPVVEPGAPAHEPKTGTLRGVSARQAASAQANAELAAAAQRNPDGPTEAQLDTVASTLRSAFMGEGASPWTAAVGTERQGWIKAAAAAFKLLRPNDPNRPPAPSDVVPLA